MTLSDELQWRGMIKDRTFDSIEWLNQPRTFYLGSDCSGDSLTIGNLAVYMLARQLVRHGWKAVLLVGGATSLIGDPGGKDEERQLKSREEIAHNVEGITAQVRKLLAGDEFTVVNNYDWFKELGYLEFLRDVGKHYSMTELVQRDFIAARMGEGAGGISYAEFSYSLIQGYDYWWLFTHHDVRLQIGGSDQWGNMLSGAPLIRKKEGEEAHALSMPLVINKATGKKFGKSEEGAVWLDPSKTSPYKFYQFWLNVDDEGVEGYLKVFTELDISALEQLMTAFRAEPGQRLAQKTLAYEVTRLVHGAAKADVVRKTTEVLFGERSFSDLSDDETQLLAAELSVYTTTAEDDVRSVVVAAGLASSRTEAQRFLDSGAVSINGMRVSTNDMAALQEGHNLLKRGKNSFAIIIR